jgi:hypothetical protein
MSEGLDVWIRVIDYLKSQKNSRAGTNWKTGKKVTPKLLNTFVGLFVPPRINITDPFTVLTMDNGKILSKNEYAQGSKEAEEFIKRFRANQLGL